MEIAEYQGEAENDQRHGRGSCMYADGSTYIGQWKYNMRNGKGIYESERTKYEGQWKDDKRDGYGVYEDSIQKFEGLWKADKMWKGELTTKFAKYKGEFKNDKYDGVGTSYVQIISQTMESTWVPLFEGQWKGGQPHGTGKKYAVVQDSNNPTTQYYLLFKGTWMEGKLHGHIKEYKSSAPNRLSKWSFQGEFQNNERNGFGREFINDTVISEGMWVNGIKHGSGSDSDFEKRFVGVYVNGVPTEGKLFNRDNELVYDGEVNRWLVRDGYGVSYSYRCIEEGYWKKGLLHGPGIVYANGVWEGNFQYSQWREGTYHSVTGDIFGKSSLTGCIGRVREKNTISIGQFYDCAAAQIGIHPRKYGLLMATQAGSAKRVMQIWKYEKCESSEVYLEDWSTEDILSWMKKELE